MDIMELWSSYRRGADPEEIFSLYQECPLHEKAEGYGDVNLLHIASQNAHPEAENDMLETAYKLAMRAGAKKISALLNGTIPRTRSNPPRRRRKLRRTTRRCIRRATRTRARWSKRCSQAART